MISLILYKNIFLAIITMIYDIAIVLLVVFVGIVVMNNKLKVIDCFTDLLIKICYK